MDDKQKLDELTEAIAFWEFLSTRDRLSINKKYGKDAYPPSELEKLIFYQNWKKDKEKAIEFWSKLNMNQKEKLLLNYAPAAINIIEEQTEYSTYRDVKLICYIYEQEQKPDHSKDLMMSHEFTQKDMLQFAFECVGSFLSNNKNELEQSLVEVIIDRNKEAFDKFINKKNGNN